MRILHITPTLGCGGAEILLGNIALEQVKRGDTVTIVLLEPLHPTYESFFLKEDLEKAVTIVQINVPISFSFVKNRIVMDVDEFENIVENFKPDVIHSHLFRAELVSRYKLHENISYITHCHNNMEQFDFHAKKSMKRRLSDYLETKWLLKQYRKSENQFIAISNDTKLYFETQLPKSFKKNVHLLRNAIDTRHYFRSDHSDNSIGIKLISVGNLTANKGHDFLIDCVSQLRNEGIKVSLDILGYGPLLTQLQYQIDKLGLSEIVSLRGNVSNVNTYFSESDLYVHAAHKEGFGLVLLEAMASKLPVITTDGGGNRDLIQENSNGFLIKNRDFKLFIEKIKYLIDRVDVRKEMGENALLFSKSYDIVPYVNQLNDIYLKKKWLEIA